MHEVKIRQDKTTFILSGEKYNINISSMELWNRLLNNKRILFIDVLIPISRTGEKHGKTSLVCKKIVSLTSYNMTWVQSKRSKRTSKGSEF